MKRLKEGCVIAKDDNLEFLRAELHSQGATKECRNNFDDHSTSLSDRTLAVVGDLKVGEEMPAWLESWLEPWLEPCQ